MFTFFLYLLYCIHIYMNMGLSKNSSEGFSILFEKLPSSDEQNVSVQSRRQNPEEDWDYVGQEGKLSVDIAETQDEIVVYATMAGASPDKIEVYIHNDLLTVRGERQRSEDRGADSLNSLKLIHQECYWGRFSRSIVLPTEVRGESARAEYTRGVLKIYIPKYTSNARLSVHVVEE